MPLMRLRSLVFSSAIWLGLSAVAGAADVHRSAEPIAPKVSCNISMRYWCIVQADSVVMMTDDGAHRTWSITPAGGTTALVVVRESKLCDSEAEYRPRRTAERDVSGGVTPFEQKHVIGFSLTESRACTLEVEYPGGNGDLAREGQRLARYRILTCDGRSCRIPLLNVE